VAGSLCNIFMPEVIVIGGGLAGSAALFRAALRNKLDQHMLRSLTRPRIEYLADEQDLVAYGAAVLAREVMT
jgi:predicted NBD/HSP70 family sugar kinase